MSIKNILERYKARMDKAVTLEIENKKIFIREIDNNIYEVKKQEVNYENGKIQEKIEIKKMSYFEYCQLIILASSMNFRILESN